MHTILHLTETRETGGAESMLLHMVDHLPRDRFTPVVGLLGGGWLDDQLRARGVETVLFPLERTVDLAWIRHARRLMRERNVALIHAHEYAMNTYGALMARLTGVPCVATVHGRTYYGDRPHRRLGYRVASRWATMIAVSEEIRRLLIERVGVRPDRVRTIWNGIALDRFAATPEQARAARARLRAEWGVGGDAPVVGTVGNLDGVKGHLHLVGAAARVVKERPDARFVIAGEGPMRAPVAARIAELGLGDKVRLLGFRGDVPDLLRAIDLFVLPSLSEGLPLAVLEAMAARCPVVATDVGGTPEVVHDGATGVLVPAADEAALGDAIARLLADPDRGARLVDGGARLVAESFDMARTADRYVALYEQLIARREPAPGPG